MTVVLGVIRLSSSVFQAFFVVGGGYYTPPAANGDLWRLPPLKIFYFYFFKIFYIRTNWLVLMVCWAR